MNKKMSFTEYLNWIDENRSLFESDKKSRPRSPHPGEILKRDFLERNGITQTKLSEMIGCTHAKVNEIVNGKRGVTPEFALDLERVTDIGAETWMRIQVYFDLHRLRKADQ